MSLQDLPDEILVKIFQFLNPLDRSNSSYTCSRWRHLINDFELVNYYADYQKRNVHFSKLEIFDQKELKYVSLKGSKLRNDVSLDELKRFTSQMKYLNLNSAVSQNEKLLIGL